MSNYLKAVSETDDELRVANYIVLFGGRDLEGIASKYKNADGSTGNYFTPETKFDSPYIKTGAVFVDWEHGQEKKHDPVAPGENDILGVVDWATAKYDEIGLWVERVLNRRNRYMRYLETLIKEGLIGNSTEAAAGGVEIAPNGEIKAWPIQRDTLTVTPMEPRMMTQNAISAIKSLAAEHPELKALLPQAAGDAAESATERATNAQPFTDPIKETKTMNDVTMTMQEYKDLLSAQVKAPDVAPPAPAEAQDPAMKALSDRLEALTALIEKAPALKDAGYVAPDSELDHPETKSFGDFLLAVKNNNVKRLNSVYKTALSEEAGATGGYVVPTQLVTPMMEAAAPYSVLRQAGATVIPMTGKTVQVPSIDVTTAPSAGDTAYAAGVIAYWEGEADTLTESEPRFRMVELTAHKLAGYSLASNELRADAATSIDALLTTMFGRAIGSKENYAFFRGTGNGQPLGALNAPGLIASSRAGATAVALADLSQMMSDFLPGSWQKGAWFINPTVIDQLIQLVSAPISWLENARTGMPMQLLGKPLYVTGALPALGTAGDIMLIDPSYYLIGDRQSVSIAYSEHYAFVTDQAAWRFTHRVDGQPWLNSYITLEDGATTVSPFVAIT